MKIVEINLIGCGKKHYLYTDPPSSEAKWVEPSSFCPLWLVVEHGLENTSFDDAYIECEGYVELSWWAILGKEQL